MIKSSTNTFRPGFRAPRRLIFALTCSFGFQAGLGRAEMTGPYQPDNVTLHLWHLNESNAPAIDVGGNATPLMALQNGATLGSPSFPGFGTAFSAFDGGPDSDQEASRDAYLAAKPLVNSPADNTPISYAGPDGAFTFEALVRIDFDPQINFGERINTKGRERFMQIINLDADEGADRVCQFRLVPVGVLDNNPQPLLEFINLNKDGQESPIQSLTAEIPVSGDDAIKFHNWYHVAVTYNGQPSHPANLNFYWTRLDASQTTAHLIGNGSLIHNLPIDCSPDFALGQTGRQSPVNSYPHENFIGLIDEVRLSGVARTAAEMMFTGSASASAAASASSTATSPATTAISSAKSSVGESEKWGSVICLIAGALITIAGLLIWLVLVLRRLAAVGSVKSPGENPPVAAMATAIPAATTTPAAIAAAAAPLGKNPAGTLGQVEENSSRAKPSIMGENTAPEAESGFSGAVRKVGLVDLLQLECLNKKSSILEVSHANLHGLIYIEAGEIIHATTGAISGEDAFFLMFALPQGEFTLKAFERPPVHSMHGAWMDLLIEATQLLSQKARL